MRGTKSIESKKTYIKARMSTSPEYKHLASICAIIKDEIDLEEWVSYYLLLGFDHIYIYDDQSVVPVTDRLKGVADKVTVFKFTPVHTSLCKQLDAYRQFTDKHKKATKYVAFFDGDEFLVLLKHNTIREFLADHDGYGVIEILFTLFNSSGHIARPEGLVIENYTKSSQGRHAKIIAKTEQLIHCVNAHTVKAVPGTKSLKLSKASGVAQLNHYFTRSLEDWGYRLIRKQAGVNKYSLQQFNLGCPENEMTIINQGYPSLIKNFMLEHSLSNEAIVKSRPPLPKDFKWFNYLYLNPVVAKVNCSQEFALTHWLSEGSKNGLKHRDDERNLDKFNWSAYRTKIPELARSDQLAVYRHAILNSPGK
jgi:hypothetical protein